MWNDKLILQSEFDRLIAMNDSERLHEWAVQNHSDLFHQVAANSAFDELEDTRNTDDIKPDNQSQAKSDSVTQHSQSELSDTPSNHHESSTITQDADAQTSPSPVEVGNTQMADVDLIRSAYEENSVAVALTGDHVAENSESINALPESDSNLASPEETAIAPGFTQFMAGSSIASDFDATVFSESQRLDSKQLSPEKTDVSQSASLVKTSKSMTEVLSLQTTFDEDSILESTFTDVEKLIIDDESSAIVIKQDREIETNRSQKVSSEPEIDTNDDKSIITAEEENNNAQENRQQSASPINVLSTGNSIDHVINHYISNSESGFEKTNNNTDVSLTENIESTLAEKREASIRKVINRIDDHNPVVAGGSRFRLVVSVIIAASAVFFVQHYYMNGGSSLFSDPQTIELLADNNIETVANSQSILNIAENNVSSSIVEEKKMLPILPIPLAQRIQQSQTLAPVFPWRKHVVNRGDTLWDLSEHYLKNPFRYPELARWSNIKNPDLIYPGDEVNYQDEKGVEEQSYKKR